METGVEGESPRLVAGEKRGIPSLDGWRAISILLVICLHTLQDHGVQVHPHAGNALLYAIANGGLGVRIFFVISGYLITRLLLREFAQKGRVSLRQFYVRRAFRILPPLYVYIGFVSILAVLGKLTLPAKYLLLCGVFLTANVAIPKTVTFWPLEHTWSLSVEEQFYLLWPVSLVWSLSASSTEERQRRASWIALIGIVLIPCIRFAWSIPPFGRFHSAGNTLLQLDMILFGVLGAVAEGHALFERVYRAMARRPLLLAFLLYILSGWLEMMFPGKYIKSVGITINGVLTLPLLLWTVRNPHTVCGRFLNARPVAWTGILSYSLYLLQTLFLHWETTALFGLKHPMPVLASWLAIPLCGVFSFFVIERPALRLRDRVMRRTSPV